MLAVPSLDKSLCGQRAAALSLQSVCCRSVLWTPCWRCPWSSAGGIQAWVLLACSLLNLRRAPWPANARQIYIQQLLFHIPLKSWGHFWMKSFVFKPVWIFYHLDCCVCSWMCRLTKCSCRFSYILLFNTENFQCCIWPTIRRAVRSLLFLVHLMYF